MKFTRLKLERNGHMISGHPDPDVIMVIISTAEERLRTIGLLQVHAINASSSCGNCDMWMTYEVEGDVARPARPCPYPDGFTVVTEVDFPSGRIIIDDSLRDAYPSFQRGEEESALYLASYNSAIGQMQYVKAMERQNLAYGPVLNTCPTIYVNDTDPTKFIIASPGYDEEGQDDAITVPGYRLDVGWVCTDLWAYSIADYQDFLKRGGKPIEENDQNGTRKVLRIHPGRYRFTLHTGESEFWIKANDDPLEPTIYAEFERLP